MTDFRSHLNPRWPLWLRCLALAPLLVNAYAPQFMDADTVMQALMSTQRVTLFFWGQDRYANVLPFLLCPVADPMWNLRLHLLANAAAFLLFLEAVSHVLSLAWAKPPTIQRRFLLFSLPLALSLLFLRPFALYQFCTSAQPYSLSMTLLIWSALVYRQRASHPALVVIAALLVLLSLGINPANILIVLALFAFSAWTGGHRQWRGFALITAVGFALWTLLSVTNHVHAPSSYLVFTPRRLVDSLRRSLHDLQHAAVYVRRVVAAIAVLLALRIAAGPPRLPEKLQRALLLSFAFSMAWWLFFLCNRWVQDNGSVFRYFFPLFFAPIICIATWLIGCIDDRQLSRLGLAVAIACVLGFGVTVIRPWTPLAKYSAFTAIAEPLHDAKAMHIRYFAGDYWLGWPLVFALRAENAPAFGVFDRGVAVRDKMLAQLQADLRRGERPVALCVGAPLQTCQEQLRELVGGHWSETRIPDGTRGSVLQLDGALP